MNKGITSCNAFFFGACTYAPIAPLTIYFKFASEYVKLNFKRKKCMIEVKVEGLPSWALLMKENLDNFQYIAPLFVEEYAWHDRVCSSYPKPNMLQDCWEVALYLFCSYISLLKNTIGRSDEADYAPPVGSLNWMILNIHGVESARKAFERFVDIEHYQGKMVFIELWRSSLFNSDHKTAQEEGEGIPWLENNCQSQN